MSGKKQSIKNESMDDQFSENISDNPMLDQIIIETIDYKPMDIEDALIELDASKQSFFVFNDARTEQLNVLYKHNNGKLGLIQPRG
jgi:putative sigma-54 modulation protein